MPGPILHIGADIICAHFAKAIPFLANPRVTIIGKAIILQAPADDFAIAGCPFVAGTVYSPCVTAKLASFSTKVTSNGLPVLLISGASICKPNGTPLIITASPTDIHVTAI